MRPYMPCAAVRARDHDRTCQGHGEEAESPDQARHPPGHRRPRYQGQHGFVNPAVYHASTVLYPTAEDQVAHRSRYQYGRRGTPTSEALEDALARTRRRQAAPASRCCRRGWRRFRPRFCRSPAAGDHILVTDSVYRPTRKFCDGVFKRLGVDDHLLRSADRRRHRRTVQAEHARGVRRGARLAKFRDAGHSGDRRGRARQGRGRADGQYLGDAALFPRLRERRRSVDPGRHQIYRRPFRHHVRLRVGQCQRRCRRCKTRSYTTGPLRRAGRYVSRAARLAHARRAACAALRSPACASRAGWSSGRKFCACCIRRSKAIPATRSGSAISPAPAACSASCSSRRAKRPCYAFMNELALFGMGFSWGGFESLVILFDCSEYRTATKWAPGGPTLRFHIGLEDVGDLIADLERGFAGDGRTATQTRVLRRAPRALPAAAHDELQIAQIDEDAKRLPDDEHRIPAVERIDRAASSRRRSRTPRMRSAPRSCRRARRRSTAPQSAWRTAVARHSRSGFPNRIADEDVVQIAADGVRDIDQHLSPPKLPERACLRRISHHTPARSRMPIHSRSHIP